MVYMLAALDYLEIKTGLANLAVQKFDGYNPQYVQIDTLQNQFIRGNNGINLCNVRQSKLEHCT